MFVKSFKDWLLIAMGLALAGLLTYVVVEMHWPHPAELERIDGAALGRAYAPVVVTTLADAWTSAADALETGKTVNESQAILQDSWKMARNAAFTSKVAPTLVKVLPEATEPKDDAQRAATVALWRAFARGLKGGR